VFEIGNSLREARLRRKIELPQVEQATKIRAKYLRALEDEQFDVLPSEIYVKGFLRAYADYLGLDGQLYVDEFNSRFVAGEDHELRPRRAAERPRRRRRRLETALVLLALGAAAVVTVVVISAWSSSSNTPAAHAVKHSKPPTRQHVAPPPTLSIRAVTGSSLVVVHRGGPAGKIAYQGTIQRGEPLVLNGKRLWLNVSTPENLLVKVRGTPIALKGGAPIVITVTPTGWSSS
jgi:cytoskeleton protein RodZ